MARNLSIEDSVMYDMSTWALPLAYNLNAYESNESISAGDCNSVFGGANNTNLPNITDASYAITIDWKQRNAPKVLSRLWQKGYRVRMAHESFTKGNKTYDPGTLVLLIGRNLDKVKNLSNDLQSAIGGTGVSYEVHLTGRMDDGLDLASNKVRPLNMPKVAMLVGPPFNTYTSGQIYFLFDQETEFPIERIRTEVLQQTDYPKFGQRYGLANLFDYDVIILAGGGNGLSQLIGEENQKIWKQWIQQGGTVIATESAAEFFTKKNSKIASVKLNTAKRDSSIEAATLNYNERETYRGHKNVPGSAVNSTVDISHPLAFGLEPELFTLKFGNRSLKPSAQFHSVVRYGSNLDDLLVAGYMSEDNKKLLDGNTSAGYLPMGQGQIIYLLDNAHYRMFWRGPSRMMQNAVMNFNK